MLLIISLGASYRESVVKGLHIVYHAVRSERVILVMFQHFIELVDHVADLRSVPTWPELEFQDRDLGAHGHVAGEAVHGLALGRQDDRLDLSYKSGSWRVRAYA